MSKTTKRVTLGLVLLCLCLGGSSLYWHRMGGSHEAKPAAGGQPSTPVAASAPAPEIALPSARAVVEPVAPPEPAVVEPVAPPQPAVARRRVSREPSEKRPAHRKKHLARMQTASARGASQAVVVPVPAAAAAAPPPAPQNKGGRVAIEIRPRLGDAVQSFEIVKVAALVDGREVSALDGKSFHEHKGEVEVWNGPVDSGEHVLAVVVEYHGNGHGVFSYFDGYRYTARSSTHFRLDEGARLEMMVELLDKGGVNTAFEKRLAIAFAPIH